MEKEISLDLIVVSEFDLRYYRSQGFFNLFCSDIEKSGMLVKPIVQELPNKKNHFLLVDGVNRVRCAKKLGWSTIVCDVVTPKTEIESIITGLKVNLKRSNHDPMGISRAFKRLKELGMKQKDIAQQFGYSKAQVSKLLALNNLSPSDKLRLARGELSIPSAYEKVKKNRDPSLMEHLGIEYHCEMCSGEITVDEYINSSKIVCCECDRKLKRLLSSEKRKLENSKSQKVF